MRNILLNYPKKISIILLLFLLIVPEFLYANDYQIKLLDFGLIEQSGKIKDITLNSDMGRTAWDKSRIIKTTDMIPAKLNTTFGIKYKLVGPAGENKLKLVARWVFPPQGLTNPETGEVYKFVDSTILVSIGDILFDTGTFDKNMDLETGTWTQQLIHNGKILLSKEFMVYE